ncbi:MAG: hypothetical protein ACRC9L_01730 [Brevinema sp.]
MKVLQNLAVLTAIIFVGGACSTAPSAEESAFLDAVKGRTATMGSASATFNSDGREVTMGSSKAVFEKADSALKAQYQNKDDNSIKTVIVLNEDKKSGSFTVNGGTAIQATLD